MVGPPGSATPPEPGSLLDRLLVGTAPEDSPVTHVEHLSARTGQTVPWPHWADTAVVERFVAHGVREPWRHQELAASAAHAGQSVVVATGTASGKSLAYQLHGLTRLAAGGRDRVLYLAPTKALARDQGRVLGELELPFLRAATFDGDTPWEERDWVRSHANWVLSNPDMLHRTVLPEHARWSAFLRHLRLVVVDECHAYRGVFGAHVALVLRRLRRACSRYGADPVFVLASATVADPGGSAMRLIGTPVRAVTDDASPRGARSFVLWEPPLTGDTGEHGAPVRRASGVETSRILADLVIEGARTLAFVRSRRGAEFAALGAVRALEAAGAGALTDRVAAYRAGYLPEERRALEAGLSSGRLMGVAATNALELGVDISGLDAVLLAGFPGTLASLWQQAGRAGRSGREALVLFVARDDPLDAYLVHHPQAIFGQPVEASVFDPANPYVLGPQLCCAAAEAPIRDEELERFCADGEMQTQAVRDVLDGLVARGLLRRRPAGWFWTADRPPSVDIRGTGGPAVSVVDASTGALIGTVDAHAAHATVHEGAVYLHRGRSYVVDAFDPLAVSDGGRDGPVALVHPESPPWSTSPRDIADITIVSTRASHRYGPLTVAFGTVDVTNQVVSYVRRRLGSGEIVDEVALTLPPRQLRTSAVWYSLPHDVLDEAGIPADRIPGAAHAAEHAAIGLLPLFATCDRWDIGGVSTALHPDTGAATVFVHDGHPGGAGFAERGHAALPAWLGATRDAIASCDCTGGCPSCVQSPKCGNGNEPLDKLAAVRLLDLVLRALDDAGDSATSGTRPRAHRRSAHDRPVRDDDDPDGDRSAAPARGQSWPARDDASGVPPGDRGGSRTHSAVDTDVRGSRDGRQVGR